MNYNKLRISLERYGRATHYAYVCGSFKQHLRQDAKYRQWKRLLEKASFKAMSPEEKRILKLMLEIKINTLQTI